MIISMKKRKANAQEIVELEPYSSEFETLFMEHWARICRLLYRIVGDPAEAEDLALETFSRLYRHHPLPDGEFNLNGWLNRVATNLGLQSVRSFKRREHYELTAGKGVLDEAPESSPAELLAQQEEHRLARQVLAAMNERQSQLLVMRYSGIAYKDMAQALNLSPTSIGPLLLRAEREFEKRYRALTEEEE